MLFLDVNKEQRLIHGVPSSRYVMSFRSIVMTSRPAASLCRVVVSPYRIVPSRQPRCRNPWRITSSCRKSSRVETLRRVVSQVVSRHYVVSEVKSCRNTIHLIIYSFSFIYLFIFLSTNLFTYLFISTKSGANGSTPGEGTRALKLDDVPRDLNLKVASHLNSAKANKATGRK